MMQLLKGLEDFWKSLGNETAYIPSGEEDAGSAQDNPCTTCLSVGQSLHDYFSKQLPPSAFKSINLGSIETLEGKRGCSTCQQIVKIGKALPCGVESGWRVVIRPGFSKLLRLHYSCYGSRPPMVFDIRFANETGFVSTVASNPGTQYIARITLAPFHSNITQMNIINQRVETDRLRKIIDHCNSSHTHSCHRPASRDLADEVFPLYLIDVTNKCLVPGSRVQRYVALSYLWGAAVGELKTMCSNLKELLKEDSLSPTSNRFSVPRTIQDAMVLTLALGEEFLWVDRYSIVQDDEATKDAQIQGMASIYGNAIFTIIAAEGDNPHCGLSGIKEGHNSPRKLQKLLSLGSECQLVEWAPDPMLLISTTWASRAWTFQESLISRRKIIFHNGRVEWRCQQHLVLEDCNLPLDVWSFDLKFANIQLTSWPNFPQYVDHVQQYCQRQLSYDADALAAFAGVLNLYSLSFLGGFLFGIPELFFDIALLWQPRRTVRQRYPFGDSYTNKRLPSWSWVRWHGQIDMSLCKLDYLLRSQEAFKSYSRQSYLRIYPILDWLKTERDSGCREKICNSYSVYRDSENIPTGWSRHPVPWSRQHEPSMGSGPTSNWYEEPSHCFQHDTDPVQNFWYPLPIPPSNRRVPNPPWEPYIRASCERTYLQIKLRTTLGFEIATLLWGDAVNEYSTLQESDTPEEVCLVDDEDHWVGILRPNGGWENVVENQRCELIAISRGALFCQGGRYEKPESAWLSERDLAEKYRSGPLGGFYEFYNVLWIEWHAGIAYRKALGRVEKSMWERAKREVIDVTLG